jgi:hypothetical protein
MSERATGTFDIDSWDEQATDVRSGATVGRVILAKTFHGDLLGTSTTEILTLVTGAGPAAYVGIENVDGELRGRKGTFALQHSAGSENGEQWLKWLIVPTSGTGELAGIRGEGQIVIGPDGGHSYTLDYDLG